jgi:hypothetical protein
MKGEGRAVVMAEKVPWWPSWWAVLLLCGGVLLFVVALNLAGRGGIGVGLTDPDLAAVRLYLRDNLDSGQWEEIRWWPKRAASKRAIYWGNKDVCMLKFRTLGRISKHNLLTLGSTTTDALEVRTLVFIIKNGKAKIGYPGSLRDSQLDRFFMSHWKAEFPNDCNDDE